MVFIKRLLLIFFSVLMLPGCQEKGGNDAPGNGVTLDFYCQKCESVKVTGKGTLISLKVSGDKITANPLVKQQISEFLTKGPDGEVYNGGSVMRTILHCDKVCTGISIAASSKLFGIESGNDLSEHVIIHYSDNPFLFDKDCKMIGVLKEECTVKEFLSYHALMLPDMELLIDDNGQSCSGLSFTIKVSLEGGEEYTGSCTIN